MWFSTDQLSPQVLLSRSQMEHPAQRPFLWQLWLCSTFLCFWPMQHFGVLTNSLWLSIPLVCFCIILAAAWIRITWWGVNCECQEAHAMLGAQEPCTFCTEVRGNHVLGNACDTKLWHRGASWFQWWTNQPFAEWNISPAFSISFPQLGQQFWCLCCSSLSSLGTAKPAKCGCVGSDAAAEFFFLLPVKHHSTFCISDKFTMEDPHIMCKEPGMASRTVTSMITAEATWQAMATK